MVLLGFIVLLLAFVVFWVGAGLSIMGANGHPAGIPTVYAGLILGVLGAGMFMYGLFS